MIEPRQVHTDDMRDGRGLYARCRGTGIDGFERRQRGRHVGLDHERNAGEALGHVHVLCGHECELKADRGIGAHLRCRLDDRADLGQALSYEIDADARFEELAGR